MTLVFDNERGGIGGTGTRMVGLTRWHALLLAAALLLCIDGGAAELPELPADAVVHQALEQHPVVRAARAGLDVGAARRDQLAAGTHEFEVTVGGARRRETATGVSLNEKEFGLQRAIRLPNKGTTDEKLGEEVMNHAESSYGDALHETGRLLLASWFAAKREALAVATGDALVTTWEEQVRVTRRRVEKGDAAALDQALSEAQLAQAEAQRGGGRQPSAQRQRHPAAAFPAAAATDGGRTARATAARGGCRKMARPDPPTQPRTRRCPQRSTAGPHRRRACRSGSRPRSQARPALGLRA